MPKIMIVAGLGSSLIHFRGDLIKSWLERGYKVVTVAPGCDVQEELTAMGCSYFAISLRRTGLNPLRDIALTFKLFCLLKLEKPDYLFTYTIKPVIYGSLAAYMHKHVRVFSMITGLGYIFIETEHYTLKRSLLRQVVIWLYRISLARNDKVFFQNPDDRAAFVKWKVVKAEKAFQVNGSGVNIDYYKPVPLPQFSVSFLLIARLLKEKGIMEYMQAAEMVKCKYPQVKFVLIGWPFEDNPSAIGQNQLIAWRKGGFVEIVDEVDDVRPYIAEAGVYVLPSYREGTPRTVLEAMAMGRAIITSDAPGCRETVIDGVNGILVPVKDSRALAEAMEKFIREPELVVQMGAESRKLVENKYDVHKINKVINREMGLL